METGPKLDTRYHSFLLVRICLVSSYHLLVFYSLLNILCQQVNLRREDFVLSVIKIVLQLVIEETLVEIHKFST